ncbi:hypothetical protein DB32_006284 [Sandaracinus amylolyticus]|uniref:Ferritin-like domain-containing protein n=2 Tax=Sandaracinus amylolyticus TaxID=927083 RepID=A0A0F6YLF3_9BACT|nr:hypothetical protein DB32_006284 [Sandaracinus amylolyticus]
MLEHAAKLRWHLDIVDQPAVHAWALALYRAGERHPETVTDYFPHGAVRAWWPELAEQLKRHAGDERGHAALYTRAIERLGEPVHDVDERDVFNHAIRAHTPISWAIHDGDGRDVIRLKVAHFLAHAHHLEKRVMRSLDYHVEACALRRRDHVLSVVERVHADEARHVRTTHDALIALTTEIERRVIVEMHERAEAAATSAFSARQTRTFLARLGSRVPFARRLVYAASAFVMEQSGG